MKSALDYTHGQITDLCDRLQSQFPSAEHATQPVLGT